MTQVGGTPGRPEGGPLRIAAKARSLLVNVRALCPVALRVALTNRRRDALMAAIVALSLVFYCLYAVFLDVTYRESGRLIAEMRLPSDIVVHMPAGIGAEDLKAVRSLYYLRRSEPAFLTPAATSLGIVDVLWLAEDSQALTGLGDIVEGRLPSAAGECMLPVTLMTKPGPRPGDHVVLGSLNVPGMPAAAAGTLPSRAVLTGYFEPGDAWFGIPVVLAGGPALASLPAVTLLFAWCDHPETFLKRAVSWIDNRLTPEAITTPYVAGRNPALAQVMVSTTAKDLGRGLQRAVYFPTGEAMFLLYIFFGVGLFTLMLLTFLDRRREYAVMKTLGLTSSQIGLVLYMEVAAIGAAGLMLGAGATLGILEIVGRAGGLALRLSPWILGSAAALGIVALVVSVWFPIGLARLATVANLLGGQAFRPFGYERRWSERHGATAANWSAPGPGSAAGTGRG